MSRDALKKLEELSQMSQLYDAKHNMSDVMKKISQNKTLQKLKISTSLMKMGALGIGQEKLDGLTGNGTFNNMLLAGALAQAMGFPVAGKIAASSAIDAQKRSAMAQQGSNKHGVINKYDTAAAGLNSMKNMSNLGKNLFYTNTALAGIANMFDNKGLQHFAQGSADISRNGFMLGPNGGGLLATKLSGGMAGLGGMANTGINKLLATAGIDAVQMNPMMLGVATMMALTKGSSFLHKMVNDKSSLGQKKAERSTVFHRKHPHQLEDQYGSVMLYQNLIAKLQSTGQIDTQTAILGQIMAAIEGHTSVLPLIAAEIINEQKSREKNTNKSLNSLEDKFGHDGKLSRWDQSKKNDPGIFFKIASSMEKYSTQFQSTFDIMGQLSNTLNGKSTTALANEAKEFGKTGDLLEAQKEFGRKYGVSTGMVQAIHTTPSQIMDQADSYEGRVLSILGLISEINRFNAHELLQIRTKGFGITAGSSSSYLAKAQQRIEEEREAREGKNELYEKLFKSVDEKLGYIPGYNVLSGSIKILNDIRKDLVDLTGDNTRSIKDTFMDWVTKGFENTNLGSEESLRAAVGANELSAEQRMATYLGFDYPNKFEELLDHIKRIDESTAAVAGPIKRQARSFETMNNFTGLMGNSDYHDSVNNDIMSKIDDEFNKLEPENASMLQRLFGIGEEAKDEIRVHQQKSFLKNNPNFLADLDTQMNDDGGLKTQSRHYSNITSSSLQDQQEQQEARIQEERQISTNEKQLITLYEIRDILKEGNSPNNSNRNRITTPTGLNDDYASMIDTSLLDDLIDVDFDNDSNIRDQRRRRGRSSSALGANNLSRFAPFISGLAPIIIPALITAGVVAAVAGAVYLYYTNNNQKKEQKEKNLKELQTYTPSEDIDYNKVYKGLKPENKDTVKGWVDALVSDDINPNYIKNKIKGLSLEKLMYMKIQIGERNPQTDKEKLLLMMVQSEIDFQSKNNTDLTNLTKPKPRSLADGDFYDSRFGMYNNLSKQSKEDKDLLLNSDNTKINSAEDIQMVMKKMKDLKLTESDLYHIYENSTNDRIKQAAGSILKSGSFNTPSIIPINGKFFNNEINDNLSDDYIKSTSNAIVNNNSLKNEQVLDYNVGLKTNDINNQAKYDQIKVSKDKALEFEKQTNQLTEALKSSLTNIDVDSKGNKAQGLSATEMRNLEAIINNITKSTGADLNRNFSQLLAIIASSASSSAEAVIELKKFTDANKVQNSDVALAVAKSGY